MARSYRMNEPFTVAMKLLVPTETKVKGVVRKVFTSSVIEGLFEYPFRIDEGNPVEFSRKMEYLDSLPVFFGSFKTYGGTENFSNGVYTIYNTATVDTWFNPEIKADCEIYICETGEVYQIISEPEDINMRHQFMQFKVEKVGGKA